eukprot:434928_1
MKIIIMTEKKTGEWDLKIIVAGISRSGTTSLGRALNILGYGPIWHMTLVPFTKLLKVSWWIDKWEKVQNNEYVDYDEFFSMVNCNVAMDVPTCQCWQQLYSYYPNAKIIICIRDDFDRWKKSFQMVADYTMNSKIITVSMYVFGAKWIKWLRNVYMPPEYKRYDFKTKDDYMNHVKEIKHKVGNDNNVFVLNVSEQKGWKQLCEFLNKPIPECSYPYANTEGGFKGRIKKMFIENVSWRVVLPIIIIVIGLIIFVLY